MFFNHKTKQITGELRDITPEERAMLEDLLAKGVMETTRHPSQEELDAADAWRATHAFNEGIDELLRKYGHDV